MFSSRKGILSKKKIVQAEELTKIFNKFTAVDHITFDVFEGEIFGFLGPNGAGKTTTINMLTTILKPTEGKATVCGYDVVKEANMVRSLIGVVPQEYTADEDLTGYENVILCASLYGLPRDLAKKRAIELLELVGLTKFKDKKVETYSGGMRRRLELACGLVNMPKVLFLDEPTLGLDVQSRKIIWQYIKLLKEEYGMTIFMTTHYLDEADNLCDRIAIIDNGKLVAIGSPNILKENLGGDILILDIEGDSDTIIELISKVENVKEVEKYGNEYRIKVTYGEIVTPKIIDVLRENGYTITKLFLTKPTLDDVYLEYTGKKLREEESSKKDFFTFRMMLRRAKS